MRIKRVLKKLGITNIEKVEFRKKEHFVKDVSELIFSKFEKHGIKYEDIYMKLINTDMYMADIASKTPRVNYVYKNSSLYFDRSIDISVITEEILYEVLRKLQDVRNKKGKIEKLGLCEFIKGKLKGMAFNEAALQYAVYIIQGNEEEKLNADGLEINSISTDYPLITNIMRQMTFIAGETYLIQSLINCTKDFKYSFRDKCSQKMYYSLMKNTDLMYEAKTKIVSLNKRIMFDNKLEESKKDLLRIKVENYSRLEKVYYSKIQKSICTYYFNKEVTKASTIEELESLRRDIGKYKHLIGSFSDKEENFFGKFSINIYYEIEKKIAEISKKNSLNIDNKGKAQTAVRSIQTLSNTNKHGKHAITNINSVSNTNNIRESK